MRKIISNDKAFVELGWEPTTELTEGVRRTVDWYRANVAPASGKLATATV